MSVDWKLKLKALLHDPPNKIVDIIGHEKRAEELFNMILYEDLKDEKVNLADRIASPQSRIIVKPSLNERKKDFEKATIVNINDSIFIDMFSGEKVKVETPDWDKTLELFKSIGSIDYKDQNDREKLTFLFLWRFYPEILPEINHHPADSRAPNHSIYDHLIQTSAIVSALPRPAFLLFSISPVQSFISKARKISDLWAGSYMLSYLTWESMKPIVKEYGPDIVVYPSLLKQPLVDRWLYYDVSFKDKFDVFKDKIWYKSFVDNSHLEERITIANMPNRFLAIVPYNKELASKCESAFKEKLRWLSSKVSKILEKYSDKRDLQKDIENHLLSYFKAYWAMMPWSKNNILPGNDQDVSDAMNDYEKLVGKNELYKSISEMINHLYYAEANVGNVYSLVLELAEKLLGARKSLRDFDQLEQPGEKCCLCGEFEALKISNDKLREGVLKEGEKLCGVCLTKRLFPEIIREELGYKEAVRFPSTSEMASIEEKVRLGDDVKEKFKELIEKLGLLPIISGSVSVPKLKKDLLYGIDGQFLMEETYEGDYLKKELNLNLDQEKVNEIKEFLKGNNIHPSKYYAILQMDGDKIGKWLKGKFNITIGEAIHEKVRKALIEFSEGEDEKEIEKILSSKHPVSPSIHQAFSRKLSTFALEEVRKIVEEDHYGKLVYAGGDDILAFVPVGKALKCAYELQKRFKETLSEKATMSGGILIVHHKYPLYLALRKVNEAKERAKDYYGRNAFCLVFMTHGGEERECGGKWNLVEFINDLVTKFHRDEISGIFPYQYLKVVEELYDGNSNESESIKEILKIELKRIFMRKEGKVDKQSLKDYLERFILPKFEEMDIKNFANMLVIAKRISSEIRKI